MTFILILVALVFPFVFFLGLSPTTQQLLASISFAVASIFTMIVLFLPKIITISLEQIDVNANVNGSTNNNTKTNNKTQSKVFNQHPSKSYQVTTSKQQNVSKIGIKSVKIESESQIITNNHNNNNNNHNSYMQNDNNIFSNMSNIDKFQLCNEQILQWRGLLLKLQDESIELNESESIVQSKLPNIKLDVIKEDSLNEMEQQLQLQHEQNNMNLENQVIEFQNENENENDFDFNANENGIIKLSK